MGEWILVTDKLPEHCQEVIIAVNSRLDNEKIVFSAIYNKDWNCFYSINGIRYDTNVTHWMPLPQLPKE